MNEPITPLVERRTALVIAGIATLISAVFWLNNLVLAWQYHAALFRGTHDAANGIFTVLRWSAADVSTVSTFIPFFGFLLIFIGICRIQNTEDWPFFPGYDRFNIALGLIGTLWGIILIGYYPAKEISVESLMKCLHTAMFSTLISVIWVMVLEPVLLRPWMNALRRNALDESPEDASLQESINAFLGGVEQGGKAVRNMGQSAAEFHKELQTLNASMREARHAEREQIEKITGCLQAMSSLLTGFQTLGAQLAEEEKTLLSEKKALEAALSDCRSELEKSHAETLQSNARATTLQERLDGEIAANQELEKHNGTLSEVAKKLNEKIADLEAANERLTRQLAAIREALH